MLRGMKETWNLKVRQDVSHKKGWNLGTNPAHVEPPPTPLIKDACNSNSENILFRYNCIEILHLVRWTSMSLIRLCLTKTIRNSFYCLYVTST